MSHTKFLSVSLVALCTSLQVLDLSYTSVCDLSPLVHVAPTLTRLSLAGTKVCARWLRDFILVGFVHVLYVCARRGVVFDVCGGGFFFFFGGGGGWVKVGIGLGVCVGNLNNF